MSEIHVLQRIKDIGVKSLEELEGKKYNEVLLQSAIITILTMISTCNGALDLMKPDKEPE